MTDETTPNLGFDPPPSIASQQPTADLVIPKPDGDAVVHQAYPLKQPIAEAKEVLIRVRGTSLRKARQKLEPLTRKKFPLPEVLLGLATLAGGGILGAIASALSLDSPRGRFFSLALPSIAVGCAVAYGFLRYFQAADACAIANAVLEEIPDPDHTT